MTRIVVIGANGQLGSALMALLPQAVGLNRADLDLTATDSIGPTLDELEPTVLINCAAYTAVDAAESDEETAYLVNATAVGAMASWCARNGARFVTFSTDYVFDGESKAPYLESDPVSPINAYGRTKAAGEHLALEANPDSLVIRTSWLLSTTHRNFLTTILDRASKGPVKVVDDQHGCPTFAGDLAAATVGAIDTDASGILHLTNEGHTTWFELARTAVELAGFDPGRVEPIRSSDLKLVARRPRWSVLGSERCDPLGIGALLPWLRSLAELTPELRWRARED